MYRREIATASSALVNNAARETDAHKDFVLLSSPARIPRLYVRRPESPSYSRDSLFDYIKKVRAFPRLLDDCPATEEFSF